MQKLFNSQTIVILNMIVATIFCYIFVWALLRLQADGNLLKFIVLVFKQSISEIGTSSKYLINFFLLPFVYGTIILLTVIWCFFGVEKVQLRNAVYVIVGVGFLFSLIGFFYADGIPLVLGAVFIMSICLICGEFEHVLALGSLLSLGSLDLADDEKQRLFCELNPNVPNCQENEPDDCE